MIVISIIIGVIVWALCLVGNIRIAQDRDRRHFTAWVVFSVFFSMITLMINAVVRGRD